MLLHDFTLMMKTRRIALVLGMYVAAPSVCTSQGVAAVRRDTQTVVFVCEHGTVKSVVAATYFNTLAAERHLSVRAVSRGTDLEAAVPSLVRDGLRRDGLTLGPFTPTAVDVSELRNSLLVVTFDRPGIEAMVAGRVPSMAWNNLPAVSTNYDIARDSIRSRVRALLDSLARNRNR